MDDHKRRKSSLKLSAISFLKVLKPKISRKRKPTTSKKEPSPSTFEIKRGGNAPGMLRFNRS